MYKATKRLIHTFLTRIGSKNLINTSVGLEVLSSFAGVIGTVSKDNYIKTGYIYFFHHSFHSSTMFWFKPVLYATDYGQHRWHRRWVNKKYFFFPVERYVLWATYKDFGNQGLENQFGNQLSVRKQFSFGPNSKECANLTGYSNVQTH